MSQKKKSYFEEVDTKVDFPKMEKELLDHWYKKGIVDKYLHKNDNNDKYFSFVDGPITANNPMGVHHAWGRTYKDLWQRFKNMQGFRERFQNGFDSQGLWVEVEVEKELGFKTKKEIEKYGVEKFVQKCKDRVKKYAAIQTEQSKRLGYFMDWDNSYFTMSDTNNYMIWHFLKVCHENGWLYKGNDSVPWCPRCQTAISQHEMLTEDYKEVVHKSIFFELPIQGADREFLLVWTTTPWTLPANIAVAVDKKMEYALVQGETGDKFYLAKDAVERIFGKNANILKTVEGQELVGLTYTAPFDHLPAVAKVMNENKDKFHKVIATDSQIMPITSVEGTGLVHTAVSAGTEDFKLGKKYGLPMIPVINDDASYIEGFDFLSGKNAKKHPEIILDYLVEEDKKDGVDWVFKIEDYKHRYPGCWRCKTELVWKVTDEWYISMDVPSKISNSQNSISNKTLRQRMIAVANDIKWIPEFGLKRELDWLNNMHDWLISKKNRYWGLSLPIWECKKCGHYEVIGSKDELKKKTYSGWSEFEGKSPHKPQIDKVKLKCGKCDSQMYRIEPVGNPWLDAGIVSFSTISKDNSESPLYLEDKDKWMKWFPADFITESFPGQFKNWFYSMIAMSTVLENTNPFKAVLGFATLLDETGRPMHKSWGNSIEFSEGADKIGVDVMRWMYAKQNVSDNLLFGYKVADEVRRQFHLKIWNIYNFFVTYANLDNWSPVRNTQSKNILDSWIKIRLNQTKFEVTKSLESFNAANAASVIESFVNDLSNWYVRRSRDRVGVVADDQGDKNAFFTTLYECLIELSKTLAPFTPFISEVIYTNLTKEESVHLADWPSASQVDKDEARLLEEMAHIREIVEKGHALRKEQGLPVRQPLLGIRVDNAKFDTKLVYLINEELNIKESILNTGSGELVVKLDTTMTPQLEEEARIRELIRNIQNERKKMGIGLTQLIDVITPWLPDDKESIQNIAKKTFTRNLDKGEFGVKEV